MSDNKRAKNLFSRFPALTWLGAFFCFLVVPLLLVNEGLQSMLRLRHASECEALFRQMNDQLTFIARHTDESHYFHRLLHYHFQRSVNSGDPVKSMQQRIEKLRKMFSGSMRFIVWDAKGKFIPELSDEKGFRYIVTNLYSFFQEIASHCREFMPGTPESLPIVEKRLGLFRSYLGRFLVPSHLRLPLQPGEMGSCILADTPDRFPFFWFDASPHLTVFCALRPALQDSDRGLHHAVATLNRENPVITSGFINIRNIKDKSAQLTATEHRQMLIELGKFENASLPNRVTADMLFSFKLLNHDLRGFCAIRKKDMVTGYPDRLKAGIMAKIIIAMALLAFVGFCYSLRLKKLTISIRTRTALLFLYANGLPLMILGTIGNEFLQQKEYSLIKEIHHQNEDLLLEIDAGYRRHKSHLTRKTKEVIHNFSAKVVDRLPNKADLSDLQHLAEELGADEVNIFGDGGDNLVYYRKSRKIPVQTFMKMYAASLLNFANLATADSTKENDQNVHHPTKTKSSSLVFDDTTILKDILYTTENVDYYTFGNEQKLCFARLLGDKHKRKFHSVLTIFWRKEATQEDYAQEYLAKLAASTSSSRYASLSIHNGRLAASDIAQKELLRTCMQKAYNLQAAQDNNLLINGNRYIATAVAGRQMANIILASITPADSIEKQIFQARLTIFFFVIVSMLIVSAVIIALSRQFINPLRQLAEAVKQVARQNFTYRTAISANDEFGDLGKVFNTTIEEMADLEIGKVVQKALFPGHEYNENALRLYARTVSMTKLGGDYYDFFSLAGNNTGLFMGDVAGHGIPAALIMAMAKGTVLTNPDKLHDPSQLLMALHQMIFRLKSDGFKKMMTCQYLVIDNVTGDCIFANAGHCFPVIVGPNGSYSRYEELIGLPVGIAKRANYSNQKIKLLVGETIVLYSDGMLEAANASGEIFGDQRYLELTQKCWHADLQQYYQCLFNANSAWSPIAEDDITIVLGRYQPEVDHG